MKDLVEEGKVSAASMQATSISSQGVKTRVESPQTKVVVPREAKTTSTKCGRGSYQEYTPTWTDIAVFMKHSMAVKRSCNAAAWYTNDSLRCKG